MKLTNVLTLSAVATVATLSLSSVAFATNNTNAEASDHKVTVCHATDSATNPYVKITVDTHAVVKAGHGGHDATVIATTTAKAQELKDAHTKWGDVIPAIPDQNFAGVNWSEEGKALFNHGCAMPTETPATTTPTEDKDHTDKEKTPVKSTVTPASTGAASTPAELPQTGASPIASVLGLGSLVTAGSYYLNSRRARQ